MPICPYCKKEMTDEKAHDDIKSFLIENGCTSNLCNPGGREFHFPVIGRIQVSDYCYHCDLDDLNNKLLSHKEI